MVVRRIGAVLVLMAMVALCLYSCKDMGNEVGGGGNGGPTPALAANPSSVIIGQSQSVNVTISNGNPPYVIDTAPNSALATASFVNPDVTPATLTITGVSTASAAGSTSVKVKDSSPSPEREVTVPITKNP